MSVYTAKPVASSTALHDEISVGAVNGGSDTNPMWTSEISSGNFGQALRESLKSVGMLASSQGEGRYLLMADLLSVDQPIAGFTLSVTMRVRYMLRNLGSNDIIYNEIIGSTGSATMGDAFFGVKRLRLANEEAAQKNIAKLIKELKRLGANVVAVK
ncbi:hypothetical protein [Salinisphaera orenii]|uniref:hypothetical protein n=1 Tax=Salinisphaera orenii TaxID=856731 RepID=UPI001C863D1A|nr:hypothetical protein [Salinisphaera orenii]